MSNQIKKKYLGENSVDGSKIQLLQGQSLVALDISGQPVDLIKVDSVSGVAKILGVEPAAKTDLSGKVDVSALGVSVAQLVNGVIPVEQLPELAITHTWVVASEAEMLALAADTGDVAIRTDVSKSFILTADTPATLSAWKELLAAASVVSVNGKTGAVVLGSDDIAEGSTNKYYTDAKVSAVIASKSSDDIAEGSTNKYFTDARAVSALSSITNGLATDIQDLEAYAQDIRNDVDSFSASVIEAANLAAIQALTGKSGVIYIAQDTKKLYHYNGSAFEEVSASANVDLSNYYTKSEADSGLATKLSLTGGTMSGDIAMGGNYKITGLADAVNNGDAMNKASVEIMVNAKVEDAIVDGVTSKAPSQNAVFDALALKASISQLDAKVEDTIVDGVTSKAPSQNAVFDALALKASTTYVDNKFKLGASLKDLVLITDANGDVSVSIGSTTSQELGYLHGVTSAVQTQLDAKLPKSGGTMTGNLSFGGSFGIGGLPTNLATYPLQASNATSKAYVDAALTAKLDASQKGAVNGVATLDSDGKLTSSQVPAIAITSVSVVASEAAMLTLTAQEGDIAIRTDLSKTFILSSNSPTTLADWKEMKTPTDAVQSVNGQTGVVSLSTSDISEGSNLYFTDARAKSAAVSDAISNGITDVAPSQNAVYDALELKLSLAGGTMSGNIAMGGNFKITGLADAENNGDAMNKASVELMLNAKVEDAIVDGVTSKAPSQNAVFDALALKASKQYVDDAIAAIPPQQTMAFHKSKIEISSELAFVDLGHEAIADSIVAFVGRLGIHKDDDFTVSVVGGVTRLTFVNSLANPSGAEKIEAGDIIYVTYAVQL